MGTTFDDLKRRALEVQNEIRRKRNTAHRVGSLFYDIISYMITSLFGIDLREPMANEAAIKAVANPGVNETRKALDTGYYWKYTGTEWINIGNILPNDALFESDLVNKLGNSAHSPIAQEIVTLELEKRVLITDIQTSVNDSENPVSSAAVNESLGVKASIFSLRDKAAKTEVIETGKNKFNLKDPDILRGYYISGVETTSGIISANNNYSISGYIPISNGESVTCNKTVAQGNIGHNIYDKDGDLIATVNNTRTVTPTQDNAAYVRFTLSVSATADLEAAQVQIESGTVSTDYEPYAEHTKIIDASVTTSKIADNAITENKILDNAVTTNKIKNEAVTPDKTNFFTASKNKFNPKDTDILRGKFINGIYSVINDNPAYTVTGYIPFENNQPLICNKQMVGTNTGINIYSDRDTVIATLNNTNIATYMDGAKYARFTLSVSATADLEAAQVQIESGTVSTDYEPYAITIKEEYILPAESVELPKLLTPRNVFIMPGNENNLYYKHLVRYLDESRHFPAGWSAGQASWQHIGRMLRIPEGVTSYFDAVVTLFDKIKEKQLFSKIIAAKTGGANTTPLKVNVIGDSFTFNGAWFTKTNELCSGLTFTGMRKSYNTTLLAEGRGGWSLGNYFAENFDGNGNGFTPFMQPKDPYRFLGNTYTWHRANLGNTDYDARDLVDKDKFDANTGVVLNPQVSDVMFFNGDVNGKLTSGSFKVWSGSAWNDISQDDLEFSFNYSKYLSTWNIATPDVVAIMLGMNDFSSVYMTDENFVIWKNRLKAFITSVKQANANIKIAFCTHICTYGLLTSASKQDIAEKNANLLRGRELVLNSFDTAEYEAQSVYIVDTGAAFDPDYGFTIEEKKPFADYIGTLTEKYSITDPHPSNDGYRMLGIPFAGFIQWVRN